MVWQLKQAKNIFTMGPNLIMVYCMYGNERKIYTYIHMAEHLQVMCSLGQSHHSHLGIGLGLGKGLSHL